MMKSIKPMCVASLAFLLAACGTTNNRINASIQELRGQPPITLTPSVEIAPSTMVGATALWIFGAPTSMVGLPGGIVTGTNAAILYLVYDPLAPNWSIKEKQLNEDTYYLAMRAKSFRTGGDGESMQILKRRARQLQLEKSYAGYRILDYSESIESSTPLTHRVSEATFKLFKEP